MHTSGLVQQDSPNTDLQFFVPATQAVSLNTSTGVSTAPTTFVGLQAQGTTNQAIVDSIAVAAATTINLKFNLTEFFVRTGMLKSGALTSLSDQAFGTAEGPGPNATPGTSGPLNLGFGASINQDTDVFLEGSNARPPISSTFLPTLGSIAGVGLIKGIRIKWIDTVYRVQGGALTEAATTLYQYIMGIGHDVSMLVNSFVSVPTVLPSAALANNSTVNKLHRERQTFTDVFGNVIPFIVDDGSLVYAVVQLITAAGTADLAGIIVGCDYNFN
jgi:hypothetical protein